jgi:protein TonB
LSLKRFFAYSIAAHTLIIAAIIFLMPVIKEKERKEFITKLVSPEELKKPEKRLLRPKIKLPLPLPPVLKKPHLPPVVPVKPKPEPSSEKPVVPGEGKGTGKPLPEGANQKIGRQEGEETGKGRLSQSKPLEKPGYFENKNLLDKGIIDQIAKKGISEKQKQDKAITLDTSEYKYAGYMGLLRGKIENSGCWAYPPDAAAKGIYGDLVIRFTIKKNGRLGAVELVRTSGHKSLDDAAIKALNDCGPYWPLPDEWGMEAYTIEGHFIYTIYGYYIR